MKQPQSSGQTHLAQCLEISYRPIRELKLDPNNPRTHTPRQIRQIARSIGEFGMNVPVLVDASLKVIAGHGRVLACQWLGWSVVPTIALEHLSAAQAKAFAIADNRLTENSEWNERLLAAQLQELSLLDLDFDLEVTGFEMGEIDLKIESLAPGADQHEEPADTIPPFSRGPTVSRPGDLWQLGNHRVLCASALDDSSYRVLLDGTRAAMVFADPPYNLQIDGHVSGLGAIHHREFAMASGEMNEDEFADFLAKVCRLLAAYSVSGAIHFICMDWRHTGELLSAGRQAYAELKNLCVWIKGSAGMGSFYRSQHELIFVFKSGTGHHRNNIRLGQFERNRTNVWQYPGALGLSRSDQEGNLLALHPTPKPVGLVVDAILDCSARGEIVLDSFLGSGTTVIAAERTGRRCFGLEIDPRYVDTIIRRWQSYCGESARHLPTSRTFQEVEAKSEITDVVR
jgi:DNA modification methylase